MRLKRKLECGVSWGVRLTHGTVVQDRSTGDVEGHWHLCNVCVSTSHFSKCKALVQNV